MFTRLIHKTISNRHLRRLCSFLILALLFSLLGSHSASAATTFMFVSSADSYVGEGSPSSNYGTNTQLWVDGDVGATYETYFKFTVTGLSGSVQSAKLRVYSTSSTVDGPLVYGTDTNWTETGITWNTRPAQISGGLDDKGAIATGVWVEYDVTPLVSSDGTFSFALVPTSTDAVSFSSREGSQPPQLAIVVTSGTAVTDTPTNTPLPQTATFTPTAGNTPTFTPTLSGPATSDEIHWTITGPNSVTIDWRGPSNYLNYGMTTAYDQTATAAAPSPMPFSSSGPFWEAKLTGLQPNTTYHYSIGGGADHTFKTALPKGNSGFMVDVIGDVGSTRTYPNVGPVQALIAADRPAIALIVGDLTYGSPEGQADVDQHFNDVQVWSLDSTAYMPAWGNHEWSVETADNLNNYKGRFDFPNPQTSPGSPAISCCGEDWYYFDYGNVRFIAYPEPWTNDSWIDWNAKATTLMDEAQADPAITFIVTFGHRPAYSSGYHAGDTTLQNYLINLGITHNKYVLNLNGHSHDYERTFPQSNVVFITVGTGGSALEQVGTCLWAICTQPSWSAQRYMHFGVLKLTFDTNNIQGAFVCGPAGGGTNDIACTPGQVIDSFTINSSGSTPTPTGTLLSLTSTPTATFTYTPAATFTPTFTATSTLVPIMNTGFHVPAANNAVTSSAGDNNGYETSPTNAYTADGLFAVDANSGTNSSTSCTNNGKDKHLFYNYTLNVPTNAAIQGIEVKLTGKVNNTSSAPMFCVQLSWDGGATWTAAKSTSTLSTTNTTYVLGTSSDVWGRTWSGSNFSDANFRVRIIDVAGATSRTFSLDAVAVQVTYR